MHRNYCLGTRSYGPLQKLKIKIARFRIYIRQNRTRADIVNGAYGGNKRGWNSNHLITRTNSQSFQRQTKGVSTVGDPHGEFYSKVISKVFFKLLHCPTADKRGIIKNLRKPFLQIIFDDLVLPF